MWLFMRHVMFVIRMMYRFFNLFFTVNLITFGMSNVGISTFNIITSNISTFHITTSNISTSNISTVNHFITLYIATAHNFIVRNSRTRAVILLF